MAIKGPIAIGTVVFLTLAAIIQRGSADVWDISILRSIVQYRTTEMNWLMLMITTVGGEIFLTSVFVVTALTLYQKHRKEAGFLFFIFFCGVALNLFLKDWYIRERPQIYPLVQETTYSFPSGHAMNSLIFFGSIIYFVRAHQIKKRILVTGSCMLLIVLIGVSRVYLAAHYVTDVIAGYIAGGVWLLIAIRLYPLASRKY